MALTCTAESLLRSAVCFECLSTKHLRAIQIWLKCQFINGNTNVTCTAEYLLAQATAAGFLNMSEKAQMAVEAYLDCQIASNGNGSPSCGNYGGGQPNFTPSTSCAIATDTSNGTQWSYYNGSWH